MIKYIGNKESVFAFNITNMDVLGKEVFREVIIFVLYLLLQMLTKTIVIFSITKELFSREEYICALNKVQKK